MFGQINSRIFGKVSACKARHFGHEFEGKCTNSVAVDLVGDSALADAPGYACHTNVPSIGHLCRAGRVSGRLRSPVTCGRRQRLSPPYRRKEHASEIRSRRPCARQHRRPQSLDGGVLPARERCPDWRAISRRSGRPGWEPGWRWGPCFQRGLRRGPRHWGCHRGPGWGTGPAGQTYPGCRRSSPACRP